MQTVSDLTLYHLPFLREKCLEHLRCNPLESWKPRELNVVSALIGYEVRKRYDHDPRMRGTKVDFLEDPLITAWYETIETGVPKWALLNAWLDPFGLCLEAPMLVAEAAIYVLGQDQAKMREIESKLDPSLVNFCPKSR